jgi:predicted permease
MLTRLQEAAARIRALYATRDLDGDLQQELESHLSLLTEDNVRRGMPLDQARRAALIRMGGAQSIREQHRAVRGLPAVEAVLQDLRFAFRLIARDRWFSAAVIGVLALGIGANTVGFTIVHAVFVRGLPFEESDRLYVVSLTNRAGRRANVSRPELQDWRDHSRSFAGLAGYRDATMNISDDRALPELAHGTWLTANTFGVLRQRPLLGRDFAPGDETAGAEPVAIIGYTLWKNRYGTDPNILGKTMRIDGQPTTIIGVMPDRMRFPDNSQIWAPFVPTEPQKRRDGRVLRAFGRLNDGTDRREAQAEMSSIAEQLEAAYPEATRDLAGLRVETFTERYIGGGARPMFMTVMGAVVFVLLVACANVANLLLSRSAYRAREIAVRTAMGATRWRVVRQLLLESVVLASIGGSLGLLLAVAGVKVFAVAMQNGGLPFWVVFSMDYVVFMYVAATCVLTAVLFGLAPALHVSKTNHSAVLKEGGRGTTGHGRVRWFSGAMVVTELALTVVLLAGAGFMIRSFMTLYAVDMGIKTDRLTTMRVQLPESKYATAEARRAFFDRLEPRLAAIPGVEAAAVTTGVPSRDGGERLLEVEASSADATPVHVSTVTITPRFFDVIGVPLVRGRNFGDGDGAPGSETVVINEDVAARFFPGEDPIGRRLRFTERAPAPDRPPDVWRTIVGVSGPILHGSSLDLYVNAVVYIPYRQESPAAASLLVRSVLPPGSLMDGVRREVQAIDRDQPIHTIQTLDQLLALDRWWYRTWGGLFGIFAVIALVLSSVGLYAVMAYAVTQRTQEIGVRMAVGAQRWQVSWLILKRGLVQLAAGLTIGVAAALLLGRVLRAGIMPTDPATVAAVALLLSLVCVAACLLPARRATRVDPVVALRAD